MIIISMDEWESSEYEFEEDIANYGIRNLAQEIIGDPVNGKILEDDDENNIGIIYMTNDVSIGDVENACRKLIDYCRERMQIKVSCYLSNVVRPEELLKEYRDIVNIYWEHSSSESDIIRKDKVSRSQSAVSDETYFADIDTPFEKLKKNQLIGEIEELFEHYEYMSNDMLMVIYHGVALCAYNYCSKRGINTGMLDEKINSKSLMTSKNKLKKWCIDIINEVVSDDTSDFEDEKITAVKDYIKKNYMNHITRETISNELYFNASYLSRLFKKEIGMSIFEYLASVRIDEAKRQLIYTDKKISTIAMDVGYNHFSHFANIFRRLTGLTPKDYRDQNKRV